METLQFYNLLPVHYTVRKKPISMDVLHIHLVLQELTLNENIIHATTKDTNTKMLALVVNL